ncbi:hypothetical protein MetMK1DRAFT_00002070 [Metallosphaera yellowstonensis MK1]|uniref:Uncharacterized protein n=1 Tax=Metallosphaera yellowstonensis MK1 TaxID=671065 RepID=H2C3W2_9CREN|nr:hypothetical protein MetMK1DRAFT_00002070 [Metallosphaera yellowstonensis MK1]
MSNRCLDVTALWYNILSSLGINHEHETFSERNLVEQVFRSLKFRL